MNDYYMIRANSVEQLKSEVQKYETMGWKMSGKSSVNREHKEKSDPKEYVNVYLQSMERECEHLYEFELNKPLSIQQFFPETAFRSQARRQLLEIKEKIKGTFRVYDLIEFLCLLNGWKDNDFLRKFVSQELSNWNKRGDIERVGGPNNGPYKYQLKSY